MEQFAHVSFPVELELGSLRLSLARAMTLTEGEVLKADQSAGTPLRVYAGEVLLATAEPVLINGKLCARIQRLMEPNGSR